MKFRHTLHVFSDNFSITFKHLLYRLVILVVAGAICFAGIYPFIQNKLLNAPEFNQLTEGIRNFVMNLLNGNVDELRDISAKVQEAFGGVMRLLESYATQLTLSLLLLLTIIIVAEWFTGIGNYATAAVINDKMTLRTDSPFFSTIIKNLGHAAMYNLIYVPLSTVYDVSVGVGMFFLVYVMVNSFLPFLVGVFLFALITVFAVALKLTFTSDWLPALIRGKMGQKQSFIYTFSRKNKNTFEVLANYVVLVLLIIAANVTFGFSTIGVGLLITVPASYIILLCFQLVNYYDREQLKYFLDKNHIVKPEKENTLTREEFFRGEN